MENYEILDIVRRYCFDLENRTILAESKISNIVNEDVDGLKLEIANLNEEVRNLKAENETLLNKVESLSLSSKVNSNRVQLEEVAAWLMSLRHRLQDSEQRKELQDLASKIGKIIYEST